jgi:hypothetical protein
MHIEKKENYTLLTSEENTVSELHSEFLKKENEFENENLILCISDSISLKKEEFSLFLVIAEQKKGKKTSFVIVNSNINVDEFPESFNIVPTLQEAEDILEMEAIERELGF